MICPECQTEYVSGVSVCADCKVSLVDAEPLDLPLHEITWVALKPVEGKIYADMIAEVLEKEGIPNYIKSDWAESAFNIEAVRLPGTQVKIFVPEDYAEQAAQILQDMVG